MRPTLRVSLLTALFFTGYSGVVMASSTACRVAVVDQLRSAQAAMHKRVHHSAATLARWKVGAAAWSKAHGGKTYAGVPAPRRSDWKPLTFTCDDVALDLSRPEAGLLVPGEALPEFAYDERTPAGVAFDFPSAGTPLAEGLGEQASVSSFFRAPYGGIPGSSGGAGSAANGPVGSSSFPPAPVPPVLASPVPAPESPTFVLLGTGMLSFLVSKLRRRTVI